MTKKLIILSGFLGSGKTSFLSLLLKRYQHLKLAVLLNDFGEAPVDSTLLDVADLENCNAKDSLIEIAGGSVFCACLKESFVKALIALADTDAELVIIEASGMSDPAGMSALLHQAKLGDHFEKPTVICLFDPVKSLKLSHVLEVIPRQVKAADAVILSKVDMSTSDELEAAREYVQTHNPQPPIYEHGFGIEGALECLNDSGALNTEVQPPAGLSLGFNTFENRPDSFIISSAPSGVDALLSAIENEKDILRAKGYLPEGDGFVYLSDTGKGFERRKTSSAPAPLTIICTPGTGTIIKETLLKQELMSN